MPDGSEANVRRSLVFAVASLLATVGVSAVHAQSMPSPDVPAERNLSGKRQSCTATNETRDQRCSISCQPGQTADCEDGEASDLPTCQCENPGAE